MIIYPLPPSELDDKTLDRQIKAIAQCLCNVHHRMIVKSDHIPLPHKNIHKDDYSLWSCECRANYLKLVEMGLACCEEYHYRSVKQLKSGEYTKSKGHKLQYVIEWANLNVPDLPILTNQPDHIVDFAQCFGKFDDLIGDGVFTPFPLVMKERYIIYLPAGYERYTEEELETPCIVGSYRNHYRFKLPPENLTCTYDNLCPDAKTGLHNNIPHSYPNPKAPTWTRREKPKWI